MKDTEILLQTFLGEPLAQATAAELGEGVAGMIYMTGFQECHQMLLNAEDIDHEKLAEEIEDCIDGMFIGAMDDPEWEPYEDFGEE